MRLIDAVDVHLDERGNGPVLVGTLRGSFRDGRRLVSSSFEYAPEFLRSAARYELSPDLPLHAGRQYTGEDNQMFGAFSDVSPDDWGAGLIDTAYARERDQTQPGSLGLFDYLVQLNDHTRMGALRFTEPGGTEWLTTDAHAGVNVYDVSRIAEAAARFEEYEATEEDMEILGYVGSSLGGARAKATVERDGLLWLLKLPSNRDRRIDIEAWEATALDIAAQAGLRVPRRKLIRLDEHRSSLLIERYDRRVLASDDAAPARALPERDEPEHTARVGYMSAMTAMQLGEQGRATYEDFADTIDGLTASSGSAARDLEEMYGRVALTLLVGNVDDHWRNHGFTREGTGSAGRWRLSPLFDVNPSRPTSRVRSRQINENDDPAHRDLRLLIEGRDVYALTAADAARVLARVAGAVEGWRQIAQGHSIPAAEIEHMTPAFDRRQLEHAKAFISKHAGASAPRIVENQADTQAEIQAERRRRFPELFSDGPVGDGPEDGLERS